MADAGARQGSRKHRIIAHVPPAFGPLVSVDDLAALPAADPPALLDVRWELSPTRPPPGHVVYAGGHIPGAVYVDLDMVLAAPPGRGGRHPMPSSETFTGGMRAAGVRNGAPVVVYDAATSMAAARAWWLLRYFGHERVAVLDGGLAAWVAAGHQTHTQEPEVRPGDFTARPGGMPLLDADAAAAIADHGVLLDARAPERFSGETEPIDPVAGHIPSARNLPSGRNVDGEGRFLSRDALRDGFGQIGIEEGAEIGAYCGSGVVAAHEVLALAVAGYAAALYVGSWSDWITDPQRPVAVGSD